jgi:ABC-type nitrate/sulfonate/bicarbonate transport system substrate-binding protein
MKRLFPALALALLLAACGGSAAPAAPTSSPPASAAAPKPASAPASAKPASSAAAKPAASGSAVASAAAKPAAGAPGQIKSFYSTVSPTFTPLWIAKEAGIFQKNGLDVDVQLLQNPSGTAALLANQVQIGLSGAADLLGPNTNGGDLIAMATMTSTYPYVFEVSKDINTPADLKGKKIGASQAGGSDYVALLSVLGKLNLDFQKDVSILFVGGIPQRTAALLGGNVVGTLTAPPETLKVEGQGFHSLVDVTSLNLPSATSTLTAHRAWVDANHAAVQKFVDSLIEAIAREKADKAYAEQVMSKYLKLDDKPSLDAAYDFFALKILPSQPDVSAAQFSDTVENLGKANPAIKSVDLSKVIDDSFVQDAVKRGVGK